MRRVLLGVGAAGGMLLAAAGFVVLLNLTVYVDASVPPRSDLPELPRGLSIVNETEACGSGSCYREFDIKSSRGESPDSILARLPPDEECSSHSLVDRRPLCVGYRLGPNGPQGYVSLGKWQGS
ncbi:hypothetical protein [Nocardioides bizhenqiangii]|uniref:Uncharacterized protein n=1 Tax=Nocardioides bizhenqiangii TaxID=3095076 RepID=A0ABZ0ZPW9_9ACTN|nr:MULTISPECIES: hypothetical protein [unclassified Nocardioides]MDZ5619724.1 hypothetical protein [Nocardioides sp. HM23]WQQ26268.1 hypothetical protein SHK19_20190 [Nocardioides sp. HM61]